VTFTATSDIPTMPLMWTSNVDLDTDASTMCNTRNNQAAKYCVVTGTTITLASGVTLRAHGLKPLVLLATSTFDLQGTFDVSSKQSGTPAGTGAGAALAAACPSTTAPMGNSGGFGGSFGGKGGSSTSVDGAMGTASVALTVFPTDLRGGCPGGNGNSTTAGITPAGGSGGGAVAIIADALQLNGKINASGASGKGGPGTNKSGGGGGGAGGMIVLDAPSIVAGTSPNIWLFANGGGGGQGGTGTGNGNGPGDDGREATDPTMTVAGGANINRSGGHGGDGSYGDVKKDGSDASDPINSGGGGAGGGGAGFIRAPGVTGVTIAPPSIPQ
jgi:hypothetical protein